jgi:hypothetical protein
VLAALVLGSLYALMNKRVVVSALIFGMAVHFKVYPIIYAIPIWFGIDHILDPASLFKYQLFSWERVKFGIVAAGCFLLATYTMYQMYYFPDRIVTDMSFYTKLIFIISRGKTIATTFPCIFTTCISRRIHPSSAGSHHSCRRWDWSSF